MGYIHKLSSLVKIHFKNAFIYRMDFMASIIITPIIILMEYFTWRMFFSMSPNIQGYTFDDIIKYYVIIMLVSHFIYNQVGQRVQQKIMYGDLNQFLLKPMDVISQFLSEDMAQRMIAFLVEVIPLFIIMTIVLKISLPWYNIILVLISMIFAFFINFFIGFFMGLLSFWLYKSESFQWLMFWFLMMMSGQFIPLEFFGETFFNISKFMPFYYMRYGVAQIFLGKLTVIESIQIIGIQFVWILILYGIVRFFYGIAVKQYGAVGG
jgi:ABC-2 type transport system permease protein